MFVLFRPSLLQLAWAVNKLSSICLWYPSSLIRLLYIVLVTLLIREQDCGFLAVEPHVGALHNITRRLPAHQRILPTMSLLQNVPVHAPSVAVPCAGLCGSLCWFEDASDDALIAESCIAFRRPSLPNSTCLKLSWCSRKNGSRCNISRLATVHDSHGNRCERSGCS